MLVEERVDFVRELAALVVRSPSGQVAAYPVVETVQRDGICVEVVAPAPGLPAERAVQAQELAIRIATELDVVGVLADRKSTRLNSSHANISYAVFCLKKKKQI